jgi:hypothetical protein
MRPIHHLVCALFGLWLLLHPCGAGTAHSADKIAAKVLVKDTLTAPRQEARIEAKVVAKGLLAETPLGGEPVELVVNGVTTAAGMTGGDGRAVLSFAPPGKTIVAVHVRVGNTPRVAPAEGHANLVVWERRTPVMMVEFSSLIEEPVLESPLTGLMSGLHQDVKPMPDAADELAKLSQFYYGIIYVVAVPSGADAFATGAEARTWLAAKKFPAGLVMTITGGAEALGAKIDELHEAGWKTIKTGIGRSKTFVETFLRRRLDAVLVPEPSKGEAPRKAKLAKDWKDVRKKL